ncbi:hypothetical protein ONZ78_01510 [Lactobacillus mulieris]|uniref:hypothetical protein n=1 Tax=Lactobacillus TaxID=1578 RepID=UPI001193EC87|nr:MULTISPECIES: hypothetical protein [Lactobacillus]MCF1843906.1 hypothetical protein [Lactobacillus jensenii]MCW8105459.1 hypothetical protein [Lactobacillus mulieris]MDK7348121.1 hypothetical protein [Lactobacillus mulieris]TVV05906.1 hypothetical protein FOF79_01015 [Lactobacillus jensenii]
MIDAVNPYEEIYNKIIEDCKKTGVATFDYLPDENQSYPFFMVGDQINTDEYTKDRVLGTSSISIHCWAEWNYRSDVTRLLELALKEIYQDSQTEHFKFNIVSSHTSILQDKEGDISLWHGLLSLEVNYF